MIFPPVSNMLPPQIPRAGLKSTDLEAQGILCILLPCTRSILRCISNSGGGIGDSVTRALGCATNCVRHSFGGVSEGIANSSNCILSVPDREGMSSGMEEEGGLPALPAVSLDYGFGVSLACLRGHSETFSRERLVSRLMT